MGNIHNIVVKIYFINSRFVVLATTSKIMKAGERPHSLCTMKQLLKYFACREIAFSQFIE